MGHLRKVPILAHQFILQVCKGPNSLRCPMTMSRWTLRHIHHPKLLGVIPRNKGRIGSSISLVVLDAMGMMGKTYRTEVSTLLETGGTQS